MPELTKSADEAVPSATTAAAGAEASEAKPDKTRSLWGDAWRDLRTNWIFIVSAVLILLLLVMAAWPGLFTNADPNNKDLANHYLQHPNYGHWFQEDWLGYDAQGRSVYARAIYGTRASLLVGAGTTVLVVILGGVIGMIAGYFGGWVDAVLSRVTDMFMGIPFLLGAMVMLNSFTDRSITVVIAALAFLGWTQTARVMRGAVITVKSTDYVQAAKALGAGTGRILFRHVMPNAIAPVIVVATISLGVYIGAEATLSFLGLGLNGVSWGNDISDGGNSIRVAQWIMLYPSIMLSVTVLAFIMLGEAVRNALDPKTR
ncbi:MULTISPECIES: ABC transporter permease [Streptomyces]|uniref:ABC transporter permease n=1 Tax=Streptomyces thermoviolaceus subsp. thermoviolaceus TaxID=66860 RepID=A0ABX0YVZ6_STRTL|nr:MULTISPECIES: ABC transporter permease [Streptomyces]MCM3262928.1 ABC transporter permease [Streptomyces thermoviolaceus]NJP15215.1 ABC transporter permease [Streptomyces thermoviolaceus subsp. thermoviolaceus]RSS07838.1 ABC transporter permease [Streptomyces sp. WAC00469]WTD47593.1 ABC transporter permease [Streptomyces thermoviolaceus]GGV75227.1 peptide ABC transporter permease [Streptomyces thermoviolaceus subsp. apingens]